MAREDYYAILGIERRAPPAEVKRAYRRLALDSHPDRFPGDEEAERRFRRISEAYETLGDPARRTRYDRSVRLPEGLDLANPPTLQTAKAVFRNVFGDMFGSRRRDRRRGRDIRYSLTIPFADAVLGSAHTICFEASGACSDCAGTGSAPGGEPASECDLCGGRGELRSKGLFSARAACGRCDGTGMVQKDPCESCRGRGLRREERRFEVNVPPGTKGGAEKIVRNQGEPGRFGGETGSLRVTINVKEDPWLRRSGDDIVLDVPISITQATLGAKVAVPTVDGWVDLEVPPGMHSGDRLRLAGKGVPTSRGGRGNQLVRVEVETPRFDGASATISRARKLLAELEELSVEGRLLPKRAHFRATEEDSESGS